jgi:hypothetical protein
LARRWRPFARAIENVTSSSRVVTPDVVPDVPETPSTSTAKPAWTNSVIRVGSELGRVCICVAIAFSSA